MNRKQLEHREQLVYGRSFAIDNYSSDGVSYFDCITVDTVKKLMNEGFLDLDRRSCFSPSVQEMLDFCAGSDDEEIWFFHGFTISRDVDCRVAIEGMGSLVPPAPKRREEFARLHHKADILEVKPDKGCYCWYD